jgi:hypothetical protein
VIPALVVLIAGGATAWMRGYLRPILAHPFVAGPPVVAPGLPPPTSAVGAAVHTDPGADTATTPMITTPPSTSAAALGDGGAAAAASGRAVSGKRGRPAPGVAPGAPRSATNAGAAPAGSERPKFLNSRE